MTRTPCPFVTVVERTSAVWGDGDAWEATTDGKDNAGQARTKAGPGMPARVARRAGMFRTGYICCSGKRSNPASISAAESSGFTATVRSAPTAYRAPDWQ